jgi:thymidylate kinase
MNNNRCDPTGSADAHCSSHASPDSSPFVITFSGIDGAGKTTQIEQLSAYLQDQGLRVTRLCFWDHVAAWSNLRAGVGERTANFSQPKSTSDNSLPAYSFSAKNNKHIRKWYLTAARSGLYLADVLRLRRLLKSTAIRNSDVVIFDRYVYDQIANISSRSAAADLYRKMILKQTPAPDLAFILDAAPAKAFARKPEYPLEFVHENRRTFLRLCKFVPQLITISDGAPEDVKSHIQSHIWRSRLFTRSAGRERTELVEETSLVRQQSCRRVQKQPTTS